MNNPPIVKISGPVPAAAVRVLSNIAGVVVAPEAVNEHWGDRFRIEYGGRVVPIRIQTASRVGVAMALLAGQLDRTRDRTPLLLVVDEATSEARRRLTEVGVSYADGRGNAHIELPGLVFHVEADRARPRHSSGASNPPTKFVGRTGRAVLPLLLEPNRQWRVTDLAETAGVSAGLAQRVITRLEVEGLLRTDGRGPKRVRTVVDPGALLEAWANEASQERMVAERAHMLAPSADALVDEVGRRFDVAAIEYAVTGAAAARRIAPFATGVPVVEVWVAQAQPIPHVLTSLEARPVEQGQNLVILQAKDDPGLAFREKHGDLWTANRFRIYADLLRDPRRGREQAQHLREEVIDAA